MISTRRSPNSFVRICVHDLPLRRHTLKLTGPRRSSTRPNSLRNAPSSPGPAPGEGIRNDAREVEAYLI
jgi:hypothetical protein